jgi:hypothetical protein
MDPCLTKQPHCNVADMHQAHSMKYNYRYTVPFCAAAVL